MYGTPVLQPLELPVLSNSEMPFRRIFLEAKRSLSLIEPHPGQTHVRSRNNRPLLDDRNIGTPLTDKGYVDWDKMLVLLRQNNLL